MEKSFKEMEKTIDEYFENLTDKQLKEDLKRANYDFYKNIKTECPCGGNMNDWHSHASDCFVINKNGRCYWCNPKKGKDNGKEKEKETRE